jgi:cytochrome P460
LLLRAENAFGRKREIFISASSREESAMTRSPSSAIVIIAGLLAVLGSIALAAQDKYTLKVPNGLAFSEFRGYENWQDVAVSQTENGIKVIVANPTMMKAYRDGIPGNGKHFPDGSKVAKIEWTSKKNAESPYFVMVPDTLKSVSFIERTRMDGHTPSFSMTPRPTRFRLMETTPNAGTSVIPQWRQKITFLRHIRRDELQ